MSAKRPGPLARPSFHNRRSSCSSARWRVRRRSHSSRASRTTSLLVANSPLSTAPRTSLAISGDRSMRSVSTVAMGLNLSVPCYRQCRGIAPVASRERFPWPGAVPRRCTRTIRRRRPQGKHTPARIPPLRRHRRRRPSTDLSASAARADCGAKTSQRTCLMPQKQCPGHARGEAVSRSVPQPAEAPRSAPRSAPRCPPSRRHATPSARRGTKPGP